MKKLIFLCLCINLYAGVIKLSNAEAQSMIEKGLNSLLKYFWCNMIKQK